MSQLVNPFQYFNMHVDYTHRLFYLNELDHFADHRAKEIVSYVPIHEGTMKFAEDDLRAVHFLSDYEELKVTIAKIYSVYVNVEILRRLGEHNTRFTHRMMGRLNVIMERTITMLESKAFGAPICFEPAPNSGNRCENYTLRMLGWAR